MPFLVVFLPFFHGVGGYHRWRDLGLWLLILLSLSFVQKVGVFFPNVTHLSVCVTVLVAAEGTLVWLLVPVTRLTVCHNRGGRRGDLSMATCPCHLPVRVCQWVGGHRGGLIVATWPCHPPSCVSPSQWPRRGPCTATRPCQPAARVPVPPAQAAVSPQMVTTSCCGASRGPWG